MKSFNNHSRKCFVCRFRMNKYTMSFELGIHYGLLSAEWDQIKDCPNTFNAIEKHHIQTKINYLNLCINQTNFKSHRSLQHLKTEIGKIDNYITEERKKSRILKDLSLIPGQTDPSKSTSQ